MPLLQTRTANLLIGFVDLIEASMRLRLGEAFRKYLELFDLARTPDIEFHRQDPTAKLEVAAANLRDALAAVDEIRATHAAEQTRLNEVLASLTTKEREISALQEQLEVLEHLSREDADKLRTALGIRQIETVVKSGKLAGFVTGVIASLIASLLFVAGQRIWDHYQDNKDRRPAIVTPSTRASQSR